MTKDEKAKFQAMYDVLQRTTDYFMDRVSELDIDISDLKKRVKELESQPRSFITIKK